MLEDGSCDLSQIETAIVETNAKLIVIRSTVPPMTTERMIEKTGKKIVFAPEFYGTTQHCDEKRFDFSFTIIGGERESCNILVQALQEVYDARHRFCLTDSRTAELCKYMANCLLASRVSFCVQFWEIAKALGVNYTELRELLLQDSRFNRAHTFVYDEHPYWESHCFDKDLMALTKFSNAPLIEDVIKYNKDCKNKYKSE